MKGYVWYGSESRPTLLGEAQSKETLLSPPESKASERLPTKRLATLPKDEPCVKEQPLEKKEEISNSNFPSSDFSTETEWDDTPPEGGFIETAIDGISRFFGDESMKSNRTHAKRLWKESGLDEKEFVKVLQEAKRIAAEQWSKGNIRKKRPMRYFFGVVKNEIRLKYGK